MSQPSLVPRARPLAGPGQSPGLASLPPVVRAGNGHEVFADSTLDRQLFVILWPLKCLICRDLISRNSPESAVVKTYSLPRIGFQCIQWAPLAEQAMTTTAGRPNIGGVIQGRRGMIALLVVKIFFG